jgi:serine acetyltransferase
MPEEDFFAMLEINLALCSREITMDLREVRQRDPACQNYVLPILTFKGFMAVQVARVFLVSPFALRVPLCFCALLFLCCSLLMLVAPSQSMRVPCHRRIGLPMFYGTTVRLITPYEQLADTRFTRYCTHTGQRMTACMVQGLVSQNLGACTTFDQAVDTQLSHSISSKGVDIHPGATIGPGLVIDHADGVVIGPCVPVFVLYLCLSASTSISVSVCVFLYLCLYLSVRTAPTN